MKPTPFHKILIANRGEIVLRVLRTARAMGYRTVAVYSDADASALHTLAADQSVYIGASLPAHSYLNIGRIIDAAKRAGADAVHPGYGFLSENASFAAACREAGLVFIGPSPESIDAMGNKARAKHLMLEAGVPCIPGYQDEDQNDARLLRAATEIGFPVILKATAGGGGRGIRRVADAAAFAEALRGARAEARHAFGNSRLLVEKAIDRPKHIEIQVFGDRYGNVIHLGERDCSVQRRHQKLIEEAPSPAVDPSLRERMGEAAVRAARAIGYEGAGTVEFLLDSRGKFYFMEMNTRLQVEHPVTEAITGLDLVELQLRIASGEPLPMRQQDVRFRGHAIEARLCSEDPRSGFAPQSGRMALWGPPEDIRVEHALASGTAIAAEYDSMIAKVIAFGSDREQARRRLLRALEDFVALGVTTNQSFLAACIRHPDFVAGTVATDFIEASGQALLAPAADADKVHAICALLLQLTAPDATQREALLAHNMPVRARFQIDEQELDARVRRLRPHVYQVEIGEADFEITTLDVKDDLVRISCESIDESIRFLRTADELSLLYRGATYRILDRKFHAESRGHRGSDGKVRAAMAGRIVLLHVSVGERVSKGQPIFTIEAMKLEHTHVSPVDGVLTTLRAEVNQQVTAHSIVAEIEVPARQEGAHRAVG